MESRAAKRLVEKAGGSLAFDSTSKIWTLTVAEKSAPVDLKALDADGLTDEIAGLQAPTDPEGFVEAPAPTGEMPKFVIAAKYPKTGDACVVVLPNGTEVAGLTSKKYFFFMLGDKAKGGAIEHCVNGRVDLR